MNPRLLIALIALLFGGCNAIAAGEGCTDVIARYRAVSDADGASGNLAKSVFNLVKKEIAAADAECAAGQDAQARAAIIESRRRHGYPADP